jgi:hypothetical protein
MKLNSYSYSILSEKEPVVKVWEAKEMRDADNQAKRSFAWLETSTIGYYVNHQILRADLRHSPGSKDVSLVVLLRCGMDADEFLRRLDEQTEEGSYETIPRLMKIVFV